MRTKEEILDYDADYSDKPCLTPIQAERYMQEYADEYLLAFVQYYQENQHGSMRPRQYDIDRFKKSLQIK